MTTKYNSFMTRLCRALLPPAMAVVMIMNSLLVTPPLAHYGQQGHPDKEKLFRVLEKRQLRKRDLKMVVKEMRRQGIPYQLTSADEQKIHRLAKYLGKEGLDSLVAAIRDNYRPAINPNPPKTVAGEKETPEQDLTNEDAKNPREADSSTPISLAILPLANDDLDTERISHGITESIINSLSKLSQLRVIPHATVIHYKSNKINAQEIGRRLTVQYVVTVKVLKQGNTLNMQVVMVDKNGVEVWSKPYKRELDKVYSLHTDVARVISENLRLRLTNEQNQQLAKTFTSNPEAYRLYTFGRFFWNTRNLEESIKKFEQAIKTDPNFALAHAALADIYNVIGTYEPTPSAERFLKARAAANKALELDDTLAEAYVARANVKGLYDLDWLGAYNDFQEAFKRNPNYGHAHYSFALNYLVPMGLLDEAAIEMKKAMELDPLSVITITNLGKIYYFKREYNKAIEQYKKALDVAQEIKAGTTTIRMRLSEAYALNKMYREALAEEEQVPERDSAYLVALRNAIAYSGEKGYWQVRFEEVKKNVDLGYDSFTAGAAYAAMAGEKELAFEYLEKAFNVHDEWLTRLKTDPMYDNIRSDRRFKDYIRSVNLEP